MPEYIERAELMKFPIRIDHYDKEHGNVNFVYGVETVLEYAKNISAADVVPVVHGRWEFDGSDFADIWKCSACGEDWYFECDPRNAETLVKFCPNCGARMDGE